MSKRILYHLSRYAPIKDFNAILSVKGSKPLMGHLIKMTSVIVGKVNSNWVRLLFVVMRACWPIIRSQGIPGYVKYLKTCTVIVQQVVAGHRLNDITPLGPRVSRSKGGLPRIFPVIVRKRICAGDTVMIKWSLSILALFRVALFDADPKLSTITNPYTGVVGFDLEIMKSVPKALSRLFGHIHSSLSVPTPVPIYSASPVSNRREGEYSTHPLALQRALQNLGYNPSIFSAISELMRSYKRMNVLQTVYKHSLKIAFHFRNPMSRRIGKIGLSQEAAGKVRIFAMVDPWTQWVLRPLHKYIFKLLRRIPMDGTFDQMLPLRKVPFGKAPLFSLDLSAATDRLPITLQQSIIQHLLGRTYSELWRTLLSRPFFVKYKPIGKGISFFIAKDITYSVGQPMGALSSWAMLALTHHVIVQIASFPFYRRYFKKYALLGDDIVIWDARVAKLYRKIMDKLGVEINPSKSIVSMDGRGLEFAKKTILNGEDVSPLTIKEYSSALATSAGFITFVKKYSISDNIVKKLLGLGYKSSESSMRWRLYLIAKYTPGDWETFLKIFTNLWKDDPTQIRVDDLQKAYMAYVDSWESMITSLRDAMIKDSVLLKQFIDGFYDPQSRLTPHKFYYVDEHVTDRSVKAPIGPFILRANVDPVILSRSTLGLISLRDSYIDVDSVRYHRAVETYKRLNNFISYDLYIPITFLRNKMARYMVFTRASTKLTYALPWLDRSTYLDILEPMLKDFYAMEDEYSRMQIQQLLSPSPETSSRPYLRDKMRLEKLWRRWSKTTISWNEEVSPDILNNKNNN